MFSQLEKAKEIPQNSDPKIQKVAHHLRNREHFAMHYSPRLVSFGPIHHGAKHLKLGEKYKLMWASRHLERTKQDAQALYQKIESNIQRLKKLFAEDVIEVFPDDKKLTWMLLVDGCALLEILEKGNLEYPEVLNLKFDQLSILLDDACLLENQLPFQALKLILSDSEDDAKLLGSMIMFLRGEPRPPKVKTEDVDSALNEGQRSADITEKDTVQGDHIIEIPLEEENSEQGKQIVQILPQESPVHLLDQLHRLLILEFPNHRDHEKGKNGSMNMIIRNIQELKAAGIEVKRSNSKKISDVHFSSGWFWAELRLPEIMVHGTADTVFLNVIAYEMCPDFKNNYKFCSYLAFMGSLIQHPDDVKELRSVGILQNALGSDEEVAKLFNTIRTKDMVPDPEIYSRVRLQIEKHYRKKWRMWIARGYHTYFSSPGTIIAFYAAVAAIVLTFIQTWCAIKQL